MKKGTILIFAAMMLMSISSFAQIGKITGKWYTIDEDGNRKSIVNIYKAPNGEYEGQIEKLLTGDVNRKCVECTGAKKGLSIAGMVVVTGMKVHGEKLSGGKILDPANGKEYSCTMTFDAKTGNLKVRGSLDKSGIMGRNQTWLRAENQ